MQILGYLKYQVFPIEKYNPNQRLKKQNLCPHLCSPNELLNWAPRLPDMDDNISTLAAIFRQFHVETISGNHANYTVMFQLSAKINL